MNGMNGKPCGWFQIGRNGCHGISPAGIEGPGLDRSDDAEPSGPSHFGRAEVEASRSMIDSPVLKDGI